MKPTKKKDAEIAAECLASQLSDLRRRYRINEPTIRYEVGQEVRHGGVKKSVVTEIVDGGKILLLDQVITNNNYGHPFDTERQMWVAWHQITPLPDDLGEQFVKDNDLVIHFSNRDIEGLLGMYYHSNTDMNPDYQRGLVWAAADKVHLIDSIFKNVDIGKFAFAFNGFDADHTYEILDGKQRLTTLIEFYEGRFVYRGKTFHQLHPHDRYHFLRYSTSVASQNIPMSREQRLRYFLKLNVSGRPQDPRHIAYVQELLREAQ